ncbi:hypothetical protein QTP86_003644 [Hemibagrus guttatus]|nr:hypothetical protein QTP86_003644 [Hemibagrus guttatus]
MSLPFFFTFNVVFLFLFITLALFFFLVHGNSLSLHGVRFSVFFALGGYARFSFFIFPFTWVVTLHQSSLFFTLSSGRRKEDKETWWWNEEVQDSVQRKRLAKKKWDMDKTEENRQEYKELQRRVKREVSKAK